MTDKSHTATATHGHCCQNVEDVMFVVDDQLMSYEEGHLVAMNFFYLHNDLKIVNANDKVRWAREQIEMATEQAEMAMEFEAIQDGRLLASEVARWLCTNGTTLDYLAAKMALYRLTTMVKTVSHGRFVEYGGPL